MFVDRIKISLKAGNGGNGHTSFVSNAQVQFGGPDGGDGGKGGDIYIRGKRDLATLHSFKLKRKFVATDGEKGEQNNRNGRGGKDVYINVPLGTVIKDETGEKVVVDITEHDQVFKILSGGAGGKGNAFYKSSVRQAPNFSQTGELTKIRDIFLELKIMADVGIIGFPNVGKSTLLSVISAARPKIANYHFTTLHPNLGVVAFKDLSFTVADIPGLIEGAAEGAGLGHYFLRHIERVRLIVHLVDISESEDRNAVEDYKKINLELKKYDERLSKLKQIVVLSKTDLLYEDQLKEHVSRFKKETGVKEVIELCSIIHQGTDELVARMANELSKIPMPEAFESDIKDFDKKDRTSIEVVRHSDGSFEVTGGRIEQLVRGIVLSDVASNAYFQKRLKEDGIIDLLVEKGMKNGDIVKIKDIVFDYVE